MYLFCVNFVQTTFTSLCSLANCHLFNTLRYIIIWTADTFKCLAFIGKGFSDLYKSTFIQHFINLQQIDS